VNEEQKRKLIARFNAMVSTETVGLGCREWLGHVAPTGYGTFQLCEGGESLSELAHRVAYAIGTDDFSILRIYSGGDRRRAVVKHGDQCVFKRCVEFSHLALGTQAENIQDNVRTGKILRGEKVGTSKLTEAEVVEVVAKYRAAQAANGGTAPRGFAMRLAQEYGVSRQMIWQISTGKWWRHALN
jgi:hypothetical protein